MMLFDHRVCDDVIHDVIHLVLSKNGLEFKIKALALLQFFLYMY